MPETLIADETATAPADAVVVEKTPIEAPVVEAAVVEAEKPAVVVPVVPEKYELKLADGSTLDVAITERTAAIARELGLSNDAAQKLLDATVKELTARETAAVESNKPGGAAWTARDTEWRAAALADKVIGGSPEKLAASTVLAKQALAKYGTPDVIQFLTDTGLGSHPAALKLLAAIGKAMGEGTFVQGAAPVPVTRVPGVIPYANEGKGPVPVVAA